MEEASYRIGRHLVPAPAMAIRGITGAGRLTLAASEGVRLACPLSRVGDKGVLCTGVPQFTGAEQCTGEDTFFGEVIIFIGTVSCLPKLAEYVLVA